jgi:hypothetical protein
MAQPVFVVFARNHMHEPVGAFSNEAAAQAYVERQNNLEKQRHPHAAMTWQVQAVDVDALT